MSGTINIAALFAATLALIVAFAWNNAATKSMEHLLPVRHKNDIVKITIIYALLVTLFIVFVVCILNETNKMYYTYTGRAFINFSKFTGSSNQILSFWAPNKNHNRGKNKEDTRDDKDIRDDK